MVTDPDVGQPAIELHVASSSWSCPRCGAAFVGAPSTCHNCGHSLSQATAGADVDTPPVARRGRRLVGALLVVALLLVATVILAQQVWGDRFPGSETVTRTGLPAVEGQPTCAYGDVAAGCVVHHFGQVRFLGPVTEEPFAADARGRALMTAGDRLLLVGAEGVIWDTRVSLPGSTQHLGEAWLAWQTSDALVIESRTFEDTFEKHFFIGVNPQTGTKLWQLVLPDSPNAPEARVIDGVLVTTRFTFSAEPSGAGTPPHSGIGDVPFDWEGIESTTLVGYDLVTGRERWRREVMPAVVVDWLGYAEGRDGPGWCLDVDDGSLDPVDEQHECAQWFGTFFFEGDFGIGVDAPGGEPWSIPPDEELVAWDDRHVATLERGDPAWLRVRNVAGGAETWTVRVALDDPETQSGPGFVGVFLDDRLVLSQFDSRLMVAHDRESGDLLWEVDDETPGVAEDGFPLLLAGDRLFRNVGGQTWQLDPDDGSTMWSFPREGFAILADGDRILFVGEHHVWVLDPPK